MLHNMRDAAQHDHNFTEKDVVCSGWGRAGLVWADRLCIYRAGMSALGAAMANPAAKLFGEIRDKLIVVT